MRGAAQAKTARVMLDELVRWARALRSLREEEDEKG